MIRKAYGGAMRSGAGPEGTLVNLPTERNNHLIERHASRERSGLVGGDAGRDWLAWEMHFDHVAARVGK